MLIKHFLDAAGYRGPLEALFPRETMARLEAYDWPGNVRELRNLVMAALALGEPALPPEGAAPREAGTGARDLLSSSYRDAKAAVLQDFERRYFKALLAKSGGNVRQAARDASMDRSYLIELLKKHRLA